MKKLLLALLLLFPFHAEAIVYVVATTQQSNAAGQTVVLPTNVANDILVMAIETSNEAISVTSPSGWAEIDTQANMGTGSAPAAGSVRLAIFWKRSTGSETNPVLPDSGDHTYVVTASIRGCITTGNPWDVETGGVQGTASTSVSWASMTYSTNAGTLTTTVDGTFIFGVLAHGTDIATSQVTAEAVPTLNNLLEVFDLNVSTQFGGGIAIFTGIKPGAGVVMDTGGTNTITATLAASSKYAMFVMALKPVPGFPLYIGSTAAVSQTVDSTATVPVGTQSGDILLLVVESSNQAISAPAGYTEIDAQASMGTGSGVGAVRMGIFYQRLTGAGSNVTVTDTGDHTIAQLYAFRNVVASGSPYDAESVAVNATAGTAADWTSGTMAYGSNGSTVTSTTANTLVLTLIANGFDSATTQISNMTCGALSNYVTLAGSNNNFGQGTGGGFAVAGGEKAVAGTIVALPATTFAATLLNSTAYAMAVIALKPPVAGVAAQQKAAFFQLFP